MQQKTELRRPFFRITGDTPFPASRFATPQAANQGFFTTPCTIFAHPLANFMNGPLLHFPHLFHLRANAPHVLRSSDRNAGKGSKKRHFLFKAMSVGWWFHVSKWMYWSPAIPLSFPKLKNEACHVEDVLRALRGRVGHHWRRFRGPGSRRAW
jgi:hypothetical protein